MSPLSLLLACCLILAVFLLCSLYVLWPWVCAVKTHIKQQINLMSPWSPWSILLVCCLLLAVFLLCTMFVLWPWLRVLPCSNENVAYDCVVAAYRENLDWLKEDFGYLPGRPNIIVYAKHQDTQTQWPGSPLLPNVGRCDHTYLHHIVTNYDTLAPMTLFTTASAYEMGVKKLKLDLIIFPRLASTKFRALGYTIPPLKSFTKPTWRARGAANFTPEIHAKTDNTVLAQVRPYGKWWKARFGKTPFPKLSYLSGVFAATREAIRGVPLEIWQGLLAEHCFGENLEVGHFMELSWYHLLTHGIKV